MVNLKYGSIATGKIFYSNGIPEIVSSAKKIEKCHSDWFKK